MRQILFALLSVALLVGSSKYPAELIRVKDADTYVLDIEVWPDVHHYKTIRLLGIDTPETRNGNKAGERIPACEIALGTAATQWVNDLFATAKKIRVSYVRPAPDAFGRWLAYVSLDGRDLGSTLITRGYARHYDGRETRRIWDCN